MSGRGNKTYCHVEPSGTGCQNDGVYSLKLRDRKTKVIFYYGSCESHLQHAYLDPRWEVLDCEEVAKSVPNNVS